MRPVLPMKRIEPLLILLLALLLSGCKLRRPSDVLPPKKMEQLLYDYHLAQAISQELPRDEKYVTMAYIEWAYSKNGITKEQLDRSLVWYTRYPKELSKIYKRLSNRVDREYKSASKELSRIEKKSFTILSGDSVDLWYLGRTALLNSSVYMDKLTYTMNWDTTFHKGDTLLLSMNSLFASTDSGVPQHAYVALSAYYRDSVSTVDTMLWDNSCISLSMVLDAKKNFSSLSGSINYLDSTDNRNGAMILSGMELMRYHEKAVPDTAVKSVSAPAAKL